MRVGGAGAGAGVAGAVGGAGGGESDRVQAAGPLADLGACVFKSLCLGPRQLPGLFHDGITGPGPPFFPYPSPAAMLPPSTGGPPPVVFGSRACCRKACAPSPAVPPR